MPVSPSVSDCLDIGIGQVREPVLVQHPHPSWRPSARTNNPVDVPCDFIGHRNRMRITIAHTATLGPRTTALVDPMCRTHLVSLSLECLPQPAADRALAA